MGFSFIYPTGFAHRPNEDGTFHSICRGCFRTLATAATEAELTPQEHEHDCAAWDRQDRDNSGERCEHSVTDQTREILRQSSACLARSARLIGVSNTLMDRTEEIIRTSRLRAEEALKSLDTPIPQFLKRAS